MKRIVAVMAAASVASCSSTEPGYVQRLGLVIEGEPPMTSLVAPTTAQRGVSFVVRATTFGSGSCTHPNGYELNVEPTRAEIRLYDNYDPPNTPCTEDLASFPREVTLRFDQAGTAEVVVIGRGFDDKVKSISQSIAVVP